MMNSRYRKESDGAGERELPEDALYGISTLRAVEAAVHSGYNLHPALIRSCGAVKLACARANMELGAFDARKFEAIEGACIEMISGRLDAHVVVDAVTCDGGVSADLNICEVLANRALQLSGMRPGCHKAISPLGDVSLNQTPAFAFAAAVLVAAVSSLRGLEQELSAVTDAIHSVAAGDARITGYASLFSTCRWAAHSSADAILGAPIFPSASREDKPDVRKFRFRAAVHLKDVTGYGFMVDDSDNNAPDFFSAAGVAFEAIGKAADALSMAARDIPENAASRIVPVAAIVHGLAETFRRVACEDDGTRWIRQTVAGDALLRGCGLLCGACAVLRKGFSI